MSATDDDKARRPRAWPSWCGPSAAHPRELVDRAIARIERGNPRLNAVIHRMYDAARKQADQVDVGSDAPFVGVPFLAKDLVATWAGEPQASGSRLTAGWIPDHDSELTRRFRAAGLSPSARPTRRSSASCR
jgi:amidase